MDKRKRELSDTEALSRQGLSAPHNCYAVPSGLWGRHEPAWGSADEAIAGPRPGQFRRETGAGNESLVKAARIAEGES